MGHTMACNNLKQTDDVEKPTARTLDPIFYPDFRHNSNLQNYVKVIEFTTKVSDDNGDAAAPLGPAADRDRHQGVKDS
eukprot:SAG11_NODE_32816_length_280_cov_1.707182_1_plen_78_part_00